MPLRALVAMNPWWDTGLIGAGFPYETTRDELNDLIESFRSQRITALIGPRRVGKTILMIQAIKHLLDNGIDPKRILFFSCDDQALFAAVSSVEEVLQFYVEQILFESFTTMSVPLHIFIDEIHVKPDWQMCLKNHTDRREKIKFIVSGSSMTMLLHGSRESLMGRVDDIHVLPLSFHQFVRFKQKIHPKETDGSWLPFLPAFSAFDDPAGYVNSLIRHAAALEALRVPIIKMYQEYLIAGGYPEYFEGVSLQRWQQRLLQDIVTRGLFRDIVLQYAIKNPEKLERLLYFVAANAAQPHSFRSMGQAVDLDSTTVSLYLSYLADARFLYVLENYSPNVAKSLRQNKKLHMGDNGVHNAFLLHRGITEKEEGILVEADCCHLAKAYEAITLSKVFYYRDDKGEVDLVIQGRDKLLPVEVKFQHQIKSEDFGSIRRFQSRYGSGQAILVTRDVLRLENDVALIPAPLLK